MHLVRVRFRIRGRGKVGLASPTITLPSREAADAPQPLKYLGEAKAIMPSRARKRAKPATLAVSGREVRVRVS